jgi:ATP-binding cassette subfamily C (CFTR/MRP) protein 1
VDGLNLDEIDPDVTRARFNTIPQDSTAALGTVRENLDPYGNRSDRDLVQALVKVSLDHLMGTKLSLGSVFEPKELSGGERQLFALAAAILRGSKVVLIDEATSQ